MLELEIPTGQIFLCACGVYWAFSFSDGLVVKNLTAMQEMQAQFLGWGDLLEKEMATHSSILAWKILWTVEPGRLQSMES